MSPAGADNKSPSSYMDNNKIRFDHAMRNTMIPEIHALEKRMNRLVAAPWNYRDAKKIIDDENDARFLRQ